MKITKRNGTITIYDDEKIVKSILKANAEVPEETMDERIASRIGDLALKRLTEENEIITTQEIRAGVYIVLMEKGYRQTAKHYINFQK